ncbi:MAG: ABC transporter permease [Trueperaceae bacterium]|nr:ABC transporter permease [Trueperaceae bacterium]MCC6312089.1 ABC transporter permease [Trueperaceae bacterium]MCO5174670.1 ABC transporter permease [Trueperaceae bacterium]MCW5819431.1 ABC transporter permease [Trueperaceae bacterium]
MSVLGVFDLQLLHDVLRLGAPLVVLALAGALTQRAGLVNIGLEGVLLAGAFAAVLGAGLTGSLVVGVACAALAGMFLALVFGWFSLYLRANLFIVGLATNAFSAAVTAYAAWLLSGQAGQLRFAGMPTLPRLALPGVAGFGPLAFLNGHTALDYLAWLLVPVVAHVLFRSRFGLRLRATGEDPAAARAAGLRVDALRYTAVAASGLLAGLAGAQLSLTLGGFVQDMSGGRGWVGLVAAIVGGATAWGSAGVALLFGAAEGVANSLQLTVRGVAPQLLLAFPYVLTLVAFVGYSAARRRRLGVGDE